MKHPRKLALVSIAATFALLAAACSDVSSTTTGGETPSGGGAVPDNSGTTITLAVNGWVGAEANANLAADLLRDKLGYTVVLKKIDEFEQFPALQTGDIDATLEVWPSVHPKEFKQYIEAGNGVVDAGLLGVTGQIGWFVPTYMLTDHPEFATWEGLKGSESLFSTSESGSQGQFVDADPSYGSYDEAIAKNLGLDFKVIYAGSESAELIALDAAYQNEDPFIFYFWTPHWAHSKYKLTQVELPPVTPECDQAAAEDPDAYACAYSPDPLYKAFNDQLQTKAPAAFAFLSAMAWTNEEQNGVALDINDGMDGAAAAQKWIDANPTAWQSWVDAGLAAG
jgi:glycine betaine/proline transport system substrate-binding protein